MNASDDFFCANCDEFLDGETALVTLLEAMDNQRPVGATVKVCDWCARAMIEENVAVPHAS